MPSTIRKTFLLLPLGATYEGVPGVDVLEDWVEVGTHYDDGS